MVVYAVAGDDVPESSGAKLRIGIPGWFVAVLVWNRLTLRNLPTMTVTDIFETEAIENRPDS
jgi:hypothetical protein